MIKPHFDKKAKRNILLVVVLLAVISLFIFSKYGGEEPITTPESTSIRGTGSSISDVTRSSNPDAESLVDNSSPVAQSALEAEEREGQRARDSGDTYIGDVLFGNDVVSDSVTIDVPDFSMPEPAPEPEPEPEPQAPEAPSLNQSNDGGKKVMSLTIEDLRSQAPRSSIKLNDMIGDSEMPSAGSLTTFVEYDNTSTQNVAQANSSNQNMAENISARGMNEAYVPGQRNRGNTSNQFTVTLGSKYYTTTAFAINSDDNGPALAIIQEGPLKGAKLQGDYQLNELAKAVNISYNKMSYKGESYDIDAISYDLNTDRPVLADDVNNHYMQRYGGLFLSAFIAEYADQLKNQTTVIGDTGNVTTVEDPLEQESERVKAAIGGPARLLTEELRKNVDRPITVYVNSNKGAGVYFLEDVVISN